MFALTLKILGRVTLSCQFKSGPGHHSNHIRFTVYRHLRRFCDRVKSLFLIKNQARKTDKITQIRTYTAARVLRGVNCG